MQFERHLLLVPPRSGLPLGAGGHGVCRCWLPSFAVRRRWSVVCLFAARRWALVLPVPRLPGLLRNSLVVLRGGRSLPAFTPKVFYVRY